MDRTGIKIEGYYNGTTHSIVGDGGEGVSWRNIAGYACEGITLNSNFPIPAGVYNVVVTDVDTDILVDVYCGDCKGAISEAYSISGLLVNAGATNSQIILGMDIVLANVLSIEDKFQIIVGGKWLNEEQRIIKTTILDPITTATVPSDTLTLKITNDSGKDLKNVYATITNSIHVKQDQYMRLITGYNDPNNPDTNRELELGSTPIVDVAGEQIIRMNDYNDPLPCRIIAYNNVVTYTKPWYPFSSIGGTYDVEDQDASIRGWIIDYRETYYYDYDHNHIVYENEKLAPYIRCDFGKGNEKCFNKLGIASDKIETLKLYASNEDRLEPDSWELLLNWYGVNSFGLDGHCYTEYGAHMYVRYHHFVNFRSFRHWKIVIPQYTKYEGLYPDYLTKIARLEFLNVSDGSDLSQNRTRPLTFVGKEKDYQPISESNNVPVTLSTVNVETVSYFDDTVVSVDVLVDGLGYDVINKTSGVIYSQGQGLTSVGDPTYEFIELSPLSGMQFKLNPYLKEGDSASIWVTDGSSVFQFRNVGDDGWLYGRNALPLSGDNDLVGQMSDGSSCDIEVRAFPLNSIDEDDTNPSSGTLCVYGSSDSDYDATETGLAFGTATSNNGTNVGTLRIRIPSFSVLGDELRFVFRTAGTGHTLTIEEAYFGIAETNYPNFVNDPAKVPVTFGGVSNFSISDSSLQYSDWISYPMTGDDEYLFSYYGSRVTDSYSDEDLYTSYLVYNNQAAYNIWGEYTTLTKAYDLAMIQVRSKYKCLTTIPLSCLVNKGADNFNLKVTLLPSDIGDVLADFGVSWEEIT